MSEIDRDLDEVIKSQIGPLINRLGLVKAGAGTSGPFSFRDYVSGNLTMRILNERGLLGIEVGPTNQQGDFRAVGIFKDALMPPPSGRWNLSIEQQCEFIEANWDWFVEHLRADKASKTIAEVDAKARAVAQRIR